MNEAHAGGANTEPQPTVLGLTLEEIIKYVEEERFVQLWCGEHASDRDLEREKSETIARTDAILALFGIGSQNWPSFFKQGRPSEWRGERIEEKSLKRAAEVGQSAGAFISELAFWDFDIETEEDGDCDVRITLRSSDGFDLTLVGLGDFWTDREYKNPVTGEVFYSGNLSEEDEMAIEDDYETDAEINWTIKIECLISKPEQSNGVVTGEVVAE